MISAPSKLSMEEESNIVNQTNSVVSIPEDSTSNITYEKPDDSPEVLVKEPSKCPFSSLLASDDKDIDSDVTNMIVPDSKELLQNTYIVKRYPRMQEENDINLNSISSALTVSLIICTVSNYLSSVTSISSMILISGITVCSATLFPTLFGSLTKSGGILGVLFMQVSLSFFFTNEMSVVFFSNRSYGSYSNCFKNRSFTISSYRCTNRFPFSIHHDCREVFQDSI